MYILSISANFTGSLISYPKTCERPVMPGFILYIPLASLFFVRSIWETSQGLGPIRFKSPFKTFIS